MTVRSYQTPIAFKTALEQRLKQAPDGGADLNRRRQLLVFDRFLARVTQAMGDAVILKGGLVLELRLERARTTKDIDLRMSGSSDEILEALQQAGQLDLGDYMTFLVQPDAYLPEITGDGIIYEGYRFKAECRLGGKVYGQAFGVDAAFGDPLVGEPDTIQVEDKLAFAGISPPTLKLYPLASHIAEKLHAYTMPRDRPNSRVKDLPDIALLAGAGDIDPAKLREALKQTFQRRDTHELPTSLPKPSPDWERPYAAMAERDSLPWTTLAEVSEAASAFLDQILGGETVGTWDAESWSWTP
ncbi:MAG: nucleotidyl transferase AbiEii/AbiGii toxin family protein [Myxococcota bacterium]